jgi:hypothetical protein
MIMLLFNSTFHARMEESPENSMSILEKTKLCPMLFDMILERRTMRKNALYIFIFFFTQKNCFLWLFIWLFILDTKRVIYIIRYKESNIYYIVYLRSFSQNRKHISHIKIIRCFSQNRKHVSHIKLSASHIK